MMLHVLFVIAALYVLFWTLLGFGIGLLTNCPTHLHTFNQRGNTLYTMSSIAAVLVILGIV